MLLLLFAAARLAAAAQASEHVPKTQQQRQHLSATTTSLSRPVAGPAALPQIVSHRYVLSLLLLLLMLLLVMLLLFVQLVRDYFQIRHSFMRELFLLPHLFLNNNLPVVLPLALFPSFRELFSHLRLAHFSALAQLANLCIWLLAGGKSFSMFRCFHRVFCITNRCERLPFGRYLCNPLTT